MEFGFLKLLKTVGDGWGRLETVGDGWGRLGTVGDGWGRLGDGTVTVTVMDGDTKGKDRKNHCKFLKKNLKIS